jgi:hypothetical protein
MNAVTYRKGYKYQLVENYRHSVPIMPQFDINTEYLELTFTGGLFIAKGYAWDGASGPTFDTLSFIRGSLVHDALYQLMRLGLLEQYWREEADKLLRDMCREDGMGRVRAWYVYRAVRQFGGDAASPENVRQVLVAP